MSQRRISVKIYADTNISVIGLYWPIISETDIYVELLYIYIYIQTWL